jgi:DnaJ-domain-containing protein 1
MAMVLALPSLAIAILYLFLYVPDLRRRSRDRKGPRPAMPALYAEYYETLGLPKTASAAEIRDAYQELAQRYGPDLNPGDKSAEERLQRVQEAYRILSDPMAR